MLTLKQVLKVNRLLEQTGRGAVSPDRHGPVDQGFPPPLPSGHTEKKVTVTLEYVEDETGDMYLVNTNAR